MFMTHSIRLEQKMLLALKERAKDNQRSFNGELIYILSQALVEVTSQTPPSDHSETER